MLFKFIRLLANKLFLDYQLKRIEKEQENLEKRQLETLAKLDDEILDYDEFGEVRL